jgi:hypothetical protein
MHTKALMTIAQLNDRRTTFDLDAQLKEVHGNKSALIRKLNSEGLTRGAIAKLMGIKYQFVKNVLDKTVKS